MVNVPGVQSLSKTGRYARRENRPRRVLPLAAGVFVVGLVVVEVAPGAPAVEVRVVHVGGVVVGMGDGELDADFARQASGAERGARAPVLIPPDLGPLFDPDHVIAQSPGKLRIAGLPGVGEDPGVQRFFTAFALLASALENPRPGHRQPLAAVQVAKLGADRHQSFSFHSNIFVTMTGQRPIYFLLSPPGEEVGERLAIHRAAACNWPPHKRRSTVRRDVHCWCGTWCHVHA